MLQPAPEIEAVTPPATLVWLRMVPAIVPLMEQLLHARPANGMESAPSLPTTVVPEDCAVQFPKGEGRGTLALIAKLQVPAGLKAACGCVAKVCLAASTPPAAPAPPRMAASAVCDKPLPPALAVLVPAATDDPSAAVATVVCAMVTAAVCP